MRGAVVRPGELCVVALGGNSLIREGERGTFAEQQAHARRTMRPLARLLRAGHRFVLTHGNGPVVGNILLRNESASRHIPPMPLDVCGADSEGGIGYLMQQTLRNELRAAGDLRDVVTLVTQTVVDPRDPGFRRPSKPIGPFFTEEQAISLIRTRRWRMREDAGRGWRRVVPSPAPVDIVEKDVIRAVARRAVVVAAGGGGIPVVRVGRGGLRGVEAVVDKDLASALLARLIGARHLIILTAVERVAVHFRKPNQRFLDRLTTSEAVRLMDRGHFPEGSMGPKVRSAVGFLRAGGRSVLITLPERLGAAFQGRTGTRIVPG